jgi:hypothetical protein
VKTPDRETLVPAVRAVDIAIDVALQRNFDEDSSLELTLRLDELFRLILEDGESLPVGIDDQDVLISKAFVMVDIAYACWTNDEPVVPLPQEVILAFKARMSLNPKHCKTTLDFTRMRLKQHGRLLSVESQSLLIPRP